MSKERELLKEALKVLEWNGIMGSHDTYNSIKELLAQPEQEQEVYSKGYAEAMRQQVYEAFEAGRKSALSKDWDKERDAMREAWCLPESKQEPVAWMWTRNYEGGGYTNKVFEFLNDAEEYAKDSKTLKSPDIIRPLYTAPPKREPLSDEKLEIMYSKHAFAMDKQEYMWGFRDAERTHGIGVDDEN